MTTQTVADQLTPAQHGVWITERALPAGAAYHLAVTVRFTGPLDVGRLRAACATVVARHPALGGAVDDDLLAIVPAGDPVALAVRPGDASELPSLVAAPFDLRRGPLARFTLLRTGDSEHLLCVVAHHLVFDGASKQILVAELAAAYNGAVPSTSDSALPPSTVDVAGAAAYWASRWREPSLPQLPGLRHTPPGTGGVAVPFTVPAADLAAAASVIGVTRFELLLAAWHALLRRYGNDTVTTALELSTADRDAPRIGLHVNELPVTSAPDPAQPFAAFARALRTALRELYTHRRVPLSHAVRLTPRAALAPLTVSYRRRADPPAFTGVDSTVDWLVFGGAVRGTANLQLVEGPSVVEGSLQLVAGSFAAEQVAAQFQALLAAAVAAPDTAIGALPLPAFSGASTVGPGPRDTVVDRFLTQVAANPGGVAVVCGDRQVSYGRLGAAADALAGRLRRQGIGPGALVGIALPRTAELLVAVLGVLRTGAAYLPLDPSYPAERIAFIRDDAGAALVLTPHDVSLDGTGDAAPDEAPSPDDLAYVIYTSGSTGRPKGVAVPHGALTNLVDSMRDHLGTHAGDTWLGLTSLSFDISTVELLLPLTVGARIVLVPPDGHRDAAAQLRLIDRHAVTHVQATPSGWRLLLEAGLTRGGLVAVTGGEALPADLAAQLGPLVGRLVNAYGPTETTVWSALADITPGGPVTIGGPVANTTLHVLDDALRPVPDGIAGELWIGGLGVAHGYRGRSGLTADRFRPDPFGAPGTRIYGTGDRVRRGPDGGLEFLGRVDNQVKLRGHRIEPGEIEARLAAHPTVAQAAVTLADPHGPRARLVAYVVPAGPVDPDALRGHVARALPGYMVPAEFVVLERFPLTPNGKLDRAALPVPAGERPAGTVGTTAPADGGTGDETIATVTGIWQEVLRIDDIGPDEDLFDLGGHSLTITQIAVRIRKRLGVDVPLDVFFDTPTIDGVAAAIAELREAR
ncbi:amino acid adenylation domain-containing protein [Dactylosporangium sp. NBC_01737]|uniref:non-ribosomal peptide synthetase n=1 Tax=Dactylosporangium sp. NBC_01737 TaxID=2975959 RepID=UPI002E12A0E2|nr:amino acid adenylation domain-containing protein [Dactylosporangium sp. NBC_01737]